MSSGSNFLNRIWQLLGMEGGEGANSTSSVKYDSSIMGPSNLAHSGISVVQKAGLPQTSVGG